MRIPFRLAICAAIFATTLYVVSFSASAYHRMPDKGAAIAACFAVEARHKANVNPRVPYNNCTAGPSDTSVSCRGYSVGGGQIIPCNNEDANFSWFAAKTCASRPSYNGAYPYQQFGAPRSGTLTCFNGCVEMWSPNADGSFNGSYALDSTCSGAYDDAKCQAENGSSYYFNKHLSACEPNLPENCPPGQEKKPSGVCGIADCPSGMKLGADGTCTNEKNECPAGNVKAPSGQCLPGDGQCAQGEAKGKDGTCKRDSNGDGTPDSEEGPDDPNKDSASGGDSCNAPPSCNGNPIMCLQLRTQWRIDCNTRKNRNIAGGHCGAGGMPVCTGDKCDAVEHAQLIQTWKTACAVEKLAGKDGPQDGGQPAWTKVGGMNQDPGSGVQAGDAPAVNEREFSTSDLDSSGFGGGGSCIGFAAGVGQGTISASYAQVFASPPAEWCTFIARLRASLIVMASAVACFIIARGV